MLPASLQFELSLLFVLCIKDVDLSLQELLVALKLKHYLSIFTIFSVLCVLKLSICTNLPYHLFSEGLLNYAGRNDEKFKRTNRNGRTGQKKLGKYKKFDIF